MINRQEILRLLPPLQARRDVVTDDQDTKDIIREVLEAHRFFSKDYDRIAFLFDAADIFFDLFLFCKRNIKYVIEKDSLQTTRSPGALIRMGNGDCKHYAGFIGGVLDALNRKGKNVKWCYRFASYNMFDPTPQHVFIVVKSAGQELWIDPVLDELDKRSPHYFFKVDKKIPMLQRIYGVNNSSGLGSVSGGQIIDASTSLPLPGVAVWAMGTDQMTVTDSAGKWALDVKGSAEIYAYKTGYYIMRAATSAVVNGYRWFVNPIGNTVDWARKDEFGSGLFYSRLIFGMDISEPPFTVTVDGQPYQFPNPAFMTRKQQYLPQGLEIHYPASYAGFGIPVGMLVASVNADRSVTIKTPSGGLYDFPGAPGAGTVQKLVANNNFLLKVLACVTGTICLSDDPYPDCLNIQREFDNILNFRNMNFATSRSTKTFFGEAFAGIASAVQAIGKGFVKFIGIIPRTAFLQLTRLNAKGMATHLYQNLLDPTKQLDIQRKWEGFGGDYKMLLNAARDGSGKKALGDLQASVGNIGVVGADDATVAAAIAAAAPIIALLASYLKSQNNPTLNGIVDTAISGMNKLLTAAGEDPIAVSTALGGKPVITTDANGNTLIIPADPTGNNNGVMSWITNNPGEAVAIGAGVVIVGGMALKKHHRKKQTA